MKQTLFLACALLCASGLRATTALADETPATPPVDPTIATSPTPAPPSAPVAAQLPHTEAASPPPALGPDIRLPMIVTDLAAMGAFAASWSLGHSGSLGPNFARVGEAVSYAVRGRM